MPDGLREMHFMKTLAGAPGRTWKPGERGQAMVEFALGSVILMILLTGMLDISQAFHYTVGLEGAVRAGARHGAFYSATTGQQAFLDDADIKLAVDRVLKGDGLANSTLKSGASCLAPSDSNTWGNPPYASTAYPSAANSPWLYICYNTQAAGKTGTRTTPPPGGDTTLAGTDLLVVLLDRYGLIGGLSSQYLKQGAGLTSIPLTAWQHFSVQG